MKKKKTEKQREKRDLVRSRRETTNEIIYVIKTWYSGLASSHETCGDAVELIKNTSERAFSINSSGMHFPFVFFFFF